MICRFCGYDFNTDTLSDSSKSKGTRDAKVPFRKERKAEDIQAGINPRVKTFAMVGLGIVVLSVFYKYNFDFNGVKYEVTQAVDKIKKGQFHFFKFNREKEDGPQKMELMDVQSFQGPEKTSGRKYRKLVVEGIFFTPGAKNFVTINGKVLSEGEVFEGVAVKKINPDSVELIVEGESKILDVNDSIPFPAKNK